MVPYYNSINLILWLIIPLQKNISKSFEGGERENERKKRTVWKLDTEGCSSLFHLDLLCNWTTRSLTEHIHFFSLESSVSVDLFISFVVGFFSIVIFLVFLALLSEMYRVNVVLVPNFFHFLFHYFNLV